MPNAFIPQPVGTVRLAATAASSRIALAKSAERNIEITNKGADPAYVAFGGSTVTAVAPTAGGAAGDYPVLAGQSKVIRTPPGATYGAAVCDAGKTADVCFTCGDGE